MKNYISIVILLLGFSFNVEATQDGSLQCQYQGNVEHFPQSLVVINQIKHELCSGEKKAYTFSEISEIIQPAVSFLEKEYESQHPDNTTWIQPWLVILEDIPNFGEQNRLKKFDTNPVSAVMFLQYGATNLEPPFPIKSCKSCAKAVRELGNLLTHLVDGFLERDLTLTKNYYAVLSNDWDSYLQDSRSQTWLDEIATRFFYSPDKEKLIGPPSTQYFLLHPSIIIENVSNAVDGEEQQEAIALEVFGFNWWQGEIPFGASIGLVHSDRRSVKDSGGALFFHINNAYTLGYSEHDDNAGWFVSVDLLKIFSDKKSELQVWQEQLSY